MAPWPAAIEREGEGHLRFGLAELGGGEGREFGGNLAIGFDDELAVLHVKAEGRVGLGGIGVLAGEGLNWAAETAGCATADVGEA